MGGKGAGEMMLQRNATLMLLLLCHASCVAGDGMRQPLLGALDERSS